MLPRPNVTNAGSLPICRVAKAAAIRAPALAAAAPSGGWESFSETENACSKTICPGRPLATTSRASRSFHSMARKCAMAT